MVNHVYDTNCTRLYLAKSLPGERLYNWLFLPGGPGVDSSSLAGLIKGMHLPGNYWLIDLIFNGTNDKYPEETSDIYLRWPQYVEDLVSQFDNPILVGHSFGGYLPFFCPTLEKLLKGLIVLNSIPTLNSPVFIQVAEENNLPSLEEAKDRFIRTPNLENMKALYVQEAEYFFSEQNRAKGIEEIVNKLQYCVRTEHWWYSGGHKSYMDIQWIPQQVPTMLIGGENDHITPFVIFEQDARFHRQNIKMTTIPNAGHFPWMEQSNVINQALEVFFKHLLEKPF